MTRTHLRLCIGVLVLTPLVACESEKSANPLSPTVAGPIPGVNITPPKGEKMKGKARWALVARNADGISFEMRMEGGPTAMDLPADRDVPAPRPRRRLHGHTGVLVAVHRLVVRR